jgi:hypothetical protein
MDGLNDQRNREGEKQLKRDFSFVIVLPPPNKGFNFKNMNLGLGCGVDTFDYFLEDFESFVSRNSDVINLRKESLNMVNFKGNYLTKSHFKKLLSRPKLHFLNVFKLRDNILTAEQVFEVYNELEKKSHENKLVARNINVRLGCGGNIKLVFGLSDVTYIALVHTHAIVSVAESERALQQANKTVQNLRRLRKVTQFMTNHNQLHRAAVAVPNKFYCGISNYGFQSITFNRGDVNGVWSGTHDMRTFLSFYGLLNNRSLRSLSFAFCHFYDCLGFSILKNVLKEMPTLTKLEFIHCTLPLVKNSDVLAFVDRLLKNTSLLNVTLAFQATHQSDDYISDETKGLIEQRTEKNRELRKIVEQVCCLLIFHHRQISPFPKDLMKIVAQILFQDRFNYFPILDKKV